uniref:Uncharacterized protein n=1 Tax=Rhizophagus irregularis (strain DAOM 181602 / DAOM 197198 / MUCL 43194) TaxID=747089 RepID=U9UDG1_RHIID
MHYPMKLEDLLIKPLEEDKITPNLHLSLHLNECTYDLTLIRAYERNIRQIIVYIFNKLRS